MTFTLADYNNVLSLDPTDPFNQGKLRAIRMQRVDRTDYRLVALFDKLQATTVQPTPPPMQQVPWAHIHPSQEDLRGRPLTPVQLAYVDRVGRDPEQVTEDQVTTLAKWVMDSAFGSDDAKLLHLVFDPIAEYHERRVLLANEKAKASVKTVAIPDIPAEAHTLVSELIQAEMPELRSYEVAERAREVISAADARRKGQEPSGEPVVPSAVDRAVSRNSGFTGAAPLAY